MSSSTPNTQFSISWKIPWIEYNRITSLPSSIGKRFITSYNNVSLCWHASFSLLPEGVTGDHSRIRFYLYYEDGPLEKFDSMTYKIAIVKPDQSICGEMTCPKYEAKCHIGGGWPGSYDKDGAKLRQKYGLNESAPLIIRITLQIPISAFSFKIENPLPTATPQQWMADLFKVIEDPERSTYSNAKLISRGGSVFYCHKIIISSQSAALDAMFRHPPAKGQQEGEYEFPGLSNDSLKAFLQFLYTGQASIENLSMTDVIEVADAAEQYNLKPLKEACCSFLWDTAIKYPWISFEIIRFSDLHGLKYLKNRSMDVLAENYEKMQMFKENVARRFWDGENGKRLREEFQLFYSRRVEPN